MLTQQRQSMRRSSRRTQDYPTLECPHRTLQHQGWLSPQAECPCHPVCSRRRERGRLSLKQPASEILPRDAGDAEQCLESGHSSISVSQSEQSLEFEPHCSSVEVSL
uniref:Uncharacterized protein n=1 Tax=Knipowitschia caucasica TaxID=637954 RepID=A0AAV2JSP5_KNICA